MSAGRQPGAASLRALMKAAVRHRPGSVWYDDDGRLYGVVDGHSPALDQPTADALARLVESGDVDARRRTFAVWVHIPHRRRDGGSGVVADRLQLPDARDGAVPLHAYGALDVGRRRAAHLALTPIDYIDASLRSDARTALLVARIDPTSRA